MTYCVGLALDQGLVLLADTRTNAGLDNIATFSKLHIVEQPGERVIALMTAGNLAVTQEVWSMLNEGIALTPEGAVETLSGAPTLFRAAQLVGEAVRRVFKEHSEGFKAQSVTFDANFLLAGQIKDSPPRLFQIYAAGNFIEATADTPFLQIGEHKYGKPILDRAARHGTTLAEAVKLVLISMDSTLRSNLSVGLPIDLVVIQRDALSLALRKRITDDDAYFASIREHWSQALRQAYRAMPEPPWLPQALSKNEP